VPDFEPFNGIRFDTTRFDPVAVTAPPYDVISPEQRTALVDGSPCNVVHIDLPVVDTEDPSTDPYVTAKAKFQQWRSEGVLITDPNPSFTVYRMSTRNDEGVEQHTTGVIGALRLSRPDEGEILCHEYTTPKAKSDRLDLLGATDANLSPIWGLSPAAGLTDLLTLDEPPIVEFEADGVRHSVWRVEDPVRIEAIRAAVGSAPVVIADGHHRYETSLAHRDAIRLTSGTSTGAESVMCFVVELAQEQLSVGPIHRLVTGLDPDVDLLGLLGDFFEIEPIDLPTSGMIRELEAAGSLALITSTGTSLLRPRPEMFREARDLDSSRLDLALEGLHGITVTYQHGVENILAAVGSGDADFGVLLRPVTVAQIVEIASGGERMPPKSTFFWPKPRTGVVLRSLRD
jgi:uncharacterized protein (DUF1015 family)